MTMPEQFLTINPVAAQRLAVKSSASITRMQTERVAYHARLLAPGSMKTKIRTVTLGGPAPIGLVVSDHPASLFVLHGTKPHKIQAKPGKVLAFTPKGGGSMIFRPSVQHPGTKPNNFLLKALRMT
jgi:hypothetical protein